MARVASSRERGVAAHDQGDIRRLKAIRKILRAGQDALPSASQGKKAKKFPPAQQALGRLRRNFNAHCEEAAKLEATPLRDRFLGLALVSSCSWDVIAFPQGVGFNSAMQAFEAVQARGKARIERDEVQVNDWLKALGERPSIRYTAGELLAAIAAQCGPPGMPASRSSTDAFASRIESIGARRLWAQMVGPAEILTYIATAYGVPLAVAPLVAFRMGLVIQEAQFRQEPNASSNMLERVRMSPYLPQEVRSDGTDAAKRLPLFLPAPAQPYGILDETLRRQMVENLRQGFESSEVPDSHKAFADAVTNLLLFAPPAMPADTTLDPRAAGVDEYWKNTNSLLALWKSATP